MASHYLYHHNWRKSTHLGHLLKVWFASGVKRPSLHSSPQADTDYGDHLPQRTDYICINTTWGVRTIIGVTDKSHTQISWGGSVVAKSHRFWLIGYDVRVEKLAAMPEYWLKGNSSTFIQQTFIILTYVPHFVLLKISQFDLLARWF